jgi:hypothetical protein
VSSQDPDVIATIAYVPCNCQTPVSIQIGIGNIVTICANVSFGIISGDLIDIIYLGVCNTPPPPGCLTTTTTIGPCGCYHIRGLDRGPEQDITYISCIDGEIIETTVGATDEIWICAVIGSVVTEAYSVFIGVCSDPEVSCEPTTTTTTTVAPTTTTTTQTPCSCFTVICPGGPGAPSRIWSYRDCNDILIEEYSSPGDIISACALNGSIIAPGLIVIISDFACDDEGSPCISGVDCTCYYLYLSDLAPENIGVNYVD